MSSTRGGVAVVFAKHFSPVAFEVKYEIPSRLIFIRAQFERFNVVFINVYAPTNGTERVCFLVVLMGFCKVVTLMSICF